MLECFFRPFKRGYLLILTFKNQSTNESLFGSTLASSLQTQFSPLSSVSPFKLEIIWMLDASICSCSFNNLCYSAICTWSRLKSMCTQGLLTISFPSITDWWVRVLRAAATQGKTPVDDGDKVVSSGFFIYIELASFTHTLLLIVVFDQGCYQGRSHRLTNQFCREFNVTRSIVGSAGGATGDLALWNNFLVVKLVF